MKTRNRDLYFALVIILAMTSWGGSWAVAKLITNDLPHEILIFWRFCITFVSLVPVIILLKASIKLNLIGFIQVIFGALLLVTYNLFFFGGVKEGYAGAGGVFVTTLNPLFTFLLTTTLFGQKIRTKDYIGLVIGLLGGMTIIQVWNVGTSNLLAGGNLFFMLAAVTWATLSIISQKSKANMNSFVFSLYIYGLAAVFAFILGIPKGVFEISHVSTPVWLYILYLSLGATTFGTTAYFYAASKLGANKASSFTFIVPTSAVLFSWLLLNEKPTGYTILGGAIALLAIYLVNMKPRKRN